MVYDLHPHFYSKYATELDFLNTVILLINAPRAMKNTGREPFYLYPICEQKVQFCTRGTLFKLVE